MKQKLSVFKTGTNFSLFFGIPFTKKFFSFKLLVANRPTAETEGITSRCKDGTHILPFDFDGLILEEIIDEIYYLQKFYDLSTFYIFNCEETRESEKWHAICLDKFPLYDAIEIISNSSADRGFQKAPYLFRKRRWVLRGTNKGERKPPAFFMKVERKSDRIKSNAHRLYIKQFHKIKIKKTFGFDEFEELDTCSYLTGNRIKK